MEDNRERSAMDIPLNFSPIRYSTDQLPARDRLSAWRDYYGPRVHGADVEPASGMPFRADVTLRALPGFGLTSAQSSPARYARTRRFLTDGREYLGLHVSFAGGACGQRGREIACDPSTAVLMNVAEAGWIMSTHAMQFCGLWIHRAKLAPLVNGLDDKVLRPVAAGSEPMRYLLAYVRYLEQQQTLTDPDVAKIASRHLRDLFVLVLGGKRDATVLAQGRGLRAARLQAIKRHVADNLGEHRLTVAAVAAHHHVTPRYVQRLFEREGTTFSEYVLYQRLACARQMLAHPRYAQWSVSAIALEAGFGDVSYFNRRFRRRYGIRPSDGRTMA
jgi:AraC-like DNA-binding protein